MQQAENYRTMEQTKQFISRLWRGGNVGVFYNQMDNRKFPTSVWGNVSDVPNATQMFADKNPAITNWFFAVNPLSAIPPRSKRGNEDIRYIGSQKDYVQLANCFYLDFDNVENLPDLPLPPSVVIRSSIRGYHAYWLLKEPITDMERYYHMLSGFADSIQEADFAAATVERKLRVPATRNCKKEYRTHYPQGFPITFEKFDLSIEYETSYFEQFEAKGADLRYIEPTEPDQSLSLVDFDITKYPAEFLEQVKQETINNVSLRLRYTSRKHHELYGQAQLVGAYVNIGIFTLDDAWQLCVDAMQKNNNQVKDWNSAAETFNSGLAEVQGQKPKGFETAYAKWCIANMDYKEIDESGTVQRTKSEKPTSIYVDNFSDFVFYQDGEWVNELREFDYENNNYVQFWQGSADDDFEGSEQAVMNFLPPPMWAAKTKRLQNSLRIGKGDYIVKNGEVTPIYDTSPWDFIPVFSPYIDPTVKPAQNYDSFLTALLGTEQQKKIFLQAVGNLLFSDHPILMGIGNNELFNHGTDLHAALIKILGGSKTTGFIQKTAKSFTFHNDYSEQAFRNLQFCRVVDVGPVQSLKSEDFIDIIYGRMIHGVDNYRGKNKKKYNSTQMFPKASILFHTPKNELSKLDPRLKQYLTFFQIAEGETLPTSPEQVTRTIQSRAFQHWLVYHALRQKDWYGKIHHPVTVATDDDRASELFAMWYTPADSTKARKEAKFRLHAKDLQSFYQDAGFTFSYSEIDRIITNTYGPEFTKKDRDREGNYYIYIKKRSQEDILSDIVTQ